MAVANVNSSTKQREEWIDILRALAMFLVVLGHVSGNKTFYTIFNPIKMPLFYILSGYFVNLNKKPGKFISDILYRLIIPWLVFSLLPLHLMGYAVKGNWAEALSYAKDFLLGYKHWFITSFIITQLLVYCLFHLFKKKDAFIAGACVILFFVGIALKDVAFFEIWAMNTALSGTLFLFLGVLLHKYKDKWIVFTKKYTWIVAAVILYVGLIVLSFIVYPGESMDFHNVYYYNWGICLALILIGTFVCISIAMKIKPCFITKYICIFGQNTLVVYLMHNFVAGKIKAVATKIPCFSSFAGYIVIAVATCLICTLISVFCGKFFPILVGKRKK